jgi:cysteine-rich repeat protein
MVALGAVVILLLCLLVVVGRLPALRADVTEVISPDMTASGVTVKANTNTLLSCSGSSSFPLMNGALTLDESTRYWMYEYTGAEPPYAGKFFISDGELTVNPGYEYLNTLNTFQAGKEYYVMSEKDMTFQCGAGLSLQATCGDGLIEPGETCDDGNTTSGDGCSSTCQTEIAYSCTDEPSVCSPLIPDIGQSSSDGASTGADLVLDNVQVNTTLTSPTQVIDVSGVVENQGQQTAPAATVMVSVDGSVQTQTFSVPALAPRGAQFISLNGISASLLPGTHEVEVCLASSPGDTSNDNCVPMTVTIADPPLGF